MRDNHCLQTQIPILITGNAKTRENDCACSERAFILSFEQAKAQFDNDCACSNQGLVLEHQRQVADAAFVQAPGTHLQSLPGGFRLAYAAYAPGGPSIINEAAWRRQQQFVEPQRLQEDIDYQLAEQMLLQPVGHEAAIKHQRPYTFSVWLHISNACNLDCSYCYVGKSSAHMSVEVGLKSVRNVFRTAQQHDFRRVKLKYAGGEAMLHFKLVQQLHDEAQRLSRLWDIPVHEVVLSNGFGLKSAETEWLSQSGIKLMISIDGVGDSHDQQRPLKGGGGSFSQIERTVDNILLPQGIRPYISVTVTRQGAPHAAEAVRWALSRRLPVNLNFYRQPSNSRDELLLEEQTIIDGMLQAYAVFEEVLPEEPFLNGLLDRVQAEAHTHTCGVQQSYVVISHSGRTVQCQMQLEQPMRVADSADLLSLVNSGPIQNLSVDEKEGCQECAFRYKCSGGCPLETFRTTGRWDIRSPHCNIYQTLMPAAFRLEGLRLLKKHGLLKA